MKVLLAIVSAYTISLGTACKSEKSSSSQPKPSLDSTLDRSLIGSWSTGCIADNLGGSVNSSTTFDANSKVSHTSVLFLGTKCTTKSATITIQGVYSTGNSLTSPTNATELDLNYSQSIFTAHDANTVAQLNQDRACNRQWIANTPQDITEEVCLGDTPESRKVKSAQIYRITGNTLEIGEKTGEPQPLERPTRFSAEKLTKVQ